MRGIRGQAGGQAGGQTEGAPAEGLDGPDAPNKSYPKTEDGLFLIVPRLPP